MENAGPCPASCLKLNFLCPSSSCRGRIHEDAVPQPGRNAGGNPYLRLQRQSVTLIFVFISTVTENFSRNQGAGQKSLKEDILMSAELTKFSVVLVPAAGDHEWALKTIHELAAFFGTSAFVPHLTLCSGSFSDTAELECLRRRLEKLTVEMEPITLHIRGLDVSAEYHKTLYVAFEEEPRLRSLFRRAKAAVRQSSGYVLNPHLSLLYADLPLGTKKALADRMSLERENMVFDEVEIVILGPVEDWSDPEGWKTFSRTRLGKN